MASRLEALALGLRRSPLGAIGALSGLTVRESVRKKVFVLLVVFTAVMLGATALLPAISPEDRVPLIETWAQRAITFFGVLMAVFLAGVSLPDDIEERRIFTLLSKPLSRWQLLAGRFTGFASLLGAFGLAAFVICSLFVRVVAYRSGGTLASRTEMAATECRVEEEDGLSKVESRSSAADPMICLVSGPGKTVAFWAFRGLDVDDLPPTVTARLTLEVQDASMLSFGDVEVLLRPQTRDASAEQAAALGWSVTFSREPVPGAPLPPRVASRTVLAKHLIPFEVEIPRGWLGNSGSIDVAVKRVTKGLTLGVRPDQVVILSSPHSFEWNFAKAIASTWLLWVVVLALTVAGSTVLSGPVNLIFGLALFVAGSMVGFVRESLPIMQERIVAAESQEKEAEHDHDHGPNDDFPVAVLRFSQAVSRVSLAAIPDLNTFDASQSILRGTDIPMSRLADGLRFALAYAAGALVAGLAFLRMREFR